MPVDLPEPAARPGLQVQAGITLNEDELVESFVRSSGPGGQNVNKVATAVELRFDVKRSASLPDWLRERVLERRDRRLTLEGVLVLSGQRFRSQDRNRADVRERLLGILRESAVVQPKRIATKPSKAAKRRRLEGKQATSTTKKLRAKPSSED